MICNICSDNSPDDAHYCIHCGALLSYEGKTQRLYKRRYIPTDDIEEERISICDLFINSNGKLYYRGCEVITINDKEKDN